MARPTDGGLRQLFRQRLRAGFHWQSVETGGTGLGIPDANFCAAGGGISDATEGWVEFKKTDGWAVRLSPEQIAWHLTRWRYGGWTLIATRRKGDELWLHEGRDAGILRERGLRETPALGTWNGGPAGWDWLAVEEALRGRHSAGRASLRGRVLGGLQEPSEAV